MQTTIRLPWIRAVGVGANWSWLPILVLIVERLSRSVFPATSPELSFGAHLAMGVAAAALLFGSVAAHALAEAAAARAEGMQTVGITLWLFGGVLRYRGAFPSAGAEARIALAGPIASFGIGGAAVGLAALAHLPAGLDGVIGWVGQANLALFAVNLLPGLPLDGGRALRALLRRAHGDFRLATFAAARAGMVIAVLMAGAGIAAALAGSPAALWATLVGFLVFFGARAETGYGLLRDRPSGLRVADAMARVPATVPDSMPLDRFEHGVLRSNRFTSFPVVRDGVPVGMIAADDVARTSPSLRARLHVRDRMLPLERANVLEADRELADAAAELLQTSITRAPVMEGDRLVGLLSLKDAERRLRYGRAPSPTGHDTPVPPMPQ